MTPAAFRELFAHLGVEFLASNRYEPPSSAGCDVTRTLYYRRNRKEFDILAGRYGPLLAIHPESEAASKAAVEPAGGAALPVRESASDADPSPRENTHLPRLEIRSLGGLLGRALYTLDALSPGDLIGEYTGIVRSARPGRPLPDGGFTSDYAWGFPRVRTLGWNLEIDAREAGGVLRFANHAADPSSYPEHFPWKGCWRIVFLARRPIAAGEELTVDYGDAYWRGGERELEAGGSF